MTRRTHKVFVYGSLLRDLHNSYLLDNATCLDFNATLNPAFDQHDFVLVSLGSYPALTHAQGDEQPMTIKGELYAVDDDTLAMLDRLEGYPRFYDRKLLPIDTIDEACEIEEEAWVYFIDKLTRPRKLVANGDWRSHDVGPFA